MLTAEQIAELRDVSREQIEYGSKVGRVTGSERQARILLALLDEHALLCSVAEAAQVFFDAAYYRDHDPAEHNFLSAALEALRKARGTK